MILDSFVFPDAGRKRGHYQDYLRLPGHGQAQRDGPVSVEPSPQSDVPGVAGRCKPESPKLVASKDLTN